MTQAYRERARQLRDEDEGDPLVLFGKIVEFFLRQHVEFAILGDDGVVAAWPMVEKGQAAKEFTATEGRDMAQPVAAASLASIPGIGVFRPLGR